MIELFQARDSIEARLIYNLLKQAGLDAGVEGEFLQGGIGELQAFGAVRVMIAEEDYEEGKAVLEDWDAGSLMLDDEGE